MNIKVIDDHQTKERILLAAKQEFAEKGYDGARTCAIAKRAQANQSMIHYYFKTKEELYSQVIHKMFGVDREVPTDMSDLMDDLSIEQKLYCHIYTLANIHFEMNDADFTRIMAIEMARGKQNLKLITELYFVPRMSREIELIKLGIKSGIFANVNPAYVIMGSISFLIFFENNRDMYSGTDLEKLIYGDDSKSKLLEYILVSTFKILTPNGREVVIPVIPPEIMSKIDKYIETIKQGRKE